MPETTYGAVYFLDNARHYKRMLDLSLATLRRHSPDLNVTIVPLDVHTDYWETLRWWIGSRAERTLKRICHAGEGMIAAKRAQNAKLKVFVDPPFDYTLFLDSDTVILRPLEPLFALATEFDVLAQTPGGQLYPPMADFISESFPKVNSGVFCSSRRFGNQMAKIIERCPMEISQIPEADQYLFSYCLHALPDLRVKFLPDLQVINVPLHASTGYSKPGQLMEATAKGQENAYVFHYILRKRIWYSSLKKMPTC